MKVLITHPGRQHSHQAATALSAAGMLAGYWAGVPAVERQAHHLPALLRRPFERYPPVPIDSERSQWFPVTPALRRIGDRALPQGLAAWNDLLACRLFDHWVCGRLERVVFDAVIACEISASTTFRRARRRGALTILDAPSIHHQAQDRLHGTTDSPRLHKRIVAIKDQEIALADHILTVSPLARDTYIAAGVEASRVHAVLLGADLNIFRPLDATRTTQGFTFLFCGASIHRKGFDLLLQAFRRVAQESPQARLRIVGPPGDAAHLLDEIGGPGITARSAVGQRELVEEFNHADCLVLPSRNDSYGMVVAEALACGVPALISDMVGAKELVRTGHNGWIVPVDDLDALTHQMRWCAANGKVVRQMRAACRISAEAATWPAYHRRLIALVLQLGKARAS